MDSKLYLCRFYLVVILSLSSLIIGSKQGLVGLIKLRATRVKSSETEELVLVA